jgi:hypothetical protein
MSEKKHILWLATKNSAGVKRKQVEIRDGAIYDAEDDKYNSHTRFLGAYVETIQQALNLYQRSGVLYFKTRREAVRAYVELENSRIQRAQKALNDLIQ